MTNRFFIKVPQIDGAPDEVVPVDPNRLHRGVINQLYQRANIQQGKQLLPVLGSERIINQFLDVSSLQAKLQEIVNDCEGTLDGFGESGKTVFKEMLQPLQALSDFMKAVAIDNLELAEEILTQFGYDIMSGSAVVGRLLSLNTNQASAMTVAYDNVVNLVENAPLVVHDMALEWASEAEIVLKKVEDLRLVEENLDTIHTEISGERNKLFQRIECVSETSTTNRLLQNFLVQTRSYLLEESDRSSQVDMETLLNQSEKAIQEIEGVETEIQKSWQSSSLHFQNNILVDDKEVTKLVSELERATRNVRDLRERFVKIAGGSTRPCDFNDAPISSEQYQKVEEIMAAREWAPRTLQKRLSEKLIGLRHVLAETLNLPDNTKDLIHASKMRVEQITSLLQKDEVVAVIQKVSPMNLSLDEIAVVTLNSTRLQELYELLICVGFVLTCNRKQLFQAYSVGSMIRLLKYLGLTDDEEVDLYKIALKQIVDRNVEECLMKDACDRWSKSQEQWIRYDVKRKVRPFRFKLTSVTASLAETLLEKYELSTGFIEVAKARKDESEKQKFQNKQAARRGQA